jgi:membrane-bound lytic murein transglycosylase A
MSGVGMKSSWRQLISISAVGLSLLAAACASPGPGARPPVGGPIGSLPPETQPGGPDQRPVLRPDIFPPAPPPPAGTLALTQLPGWDQEDHLGAFNAYVETCARHRDAAAAQVCSRARWLTSNHVVSSAQARTFLEASFVAVEAHRPDGQPGMLTAYFAPIYSARWAPDADYDAPVLSRPANLAQVGTRAQIDAGSAQSQVLAWMKAEDLFFLQIQGSGTLVMPDGSRIRAAYAADNGKPFVGIARPMAAQGLLPQNGTSGDAIRRWLSDHRGPRAREVMALNPRYIFFTTTADDGREAVGAASVPLPARRSIAIDPSHWTYGEAVWIEADAGNLMGARASYRGLVMALDTGSAIRGPVRADLYMGRGDAAGDEAGTVRHPLRMWRLIPRG